MQQDNHHPHRDLITTREVSQIIPLNPKTLANLRWQTKKSGVLKGPQFYG